MLPVQPRTVTAISIRGAFLIGSIRHVSYILLLFMNVADLEPDVFLGKRTRGVVDNVFEALKKGQ